MYISFNFNDTFYSGTATLLENEKETQYIIDLNDSNPEPIQFILHNRDGKWTSEDEIAPGLVTAAGCEIGNYDKDSLEETLVPNNYYAL